MCLSLWGSVAGCLRGLRHVDDVDLVVLLTHQGLTAPMQTDAEADSRLDRDIDAENRRLAEMEEEKKRLEQQLKELPGGPPPRR